MPLQTRETGAVKLDVARISWIEAFDSWADPEQVWGEAQECTYKLVRGLYGALGVTLCVGYGA